MRFESKGIFPLFIIFVIAGSFITLALTLSRWARDLKVIQENITVSPRLGLTSAKNEFTFCVVFDPQINVTCLNAK
jgi:hypothetical protein